MRPPHGGDPRPTGWWVLGLAGDPAAGDPNTLALLSRRLHQTADDADQARRGVLTLLADDAVVSWTGASGNAFRGACEPFPAQLNDLHGSYREAADALDAHRTRLIDARGAAGIALGRAESALGHLGMTGEDVHALADVDSDYAYWDRAERLLLAEHPVSAPSAAPGTAGLALPAPNPFAPEAPPFAVAPNPFAPRNPAVTAALTQVYQARGAARQAAQDLAVSTRTCAAAVEAASDAAVTAVRWNGTGPGAAGGGTFAQRFAALGGNAADLKLAAEAGARLDAALAPPAGATPAEVAAWWNGLTPDQQAQTAADHPDMIGNLDGIPVAVRDQINRKLLDGQLATLPKQISDARNLLTASPGDDGTPNDGLIQRIADLQTQLETLTALKAQLAATGPVYLTPNHAGGPDDQFFPNNMPPLFLLHFDTTGNGHLIMAAGDPDTSANVAVYAPGLGTNLGLHMIGNDIPHTENLVLQAQKDHPGASVASVFWLGYDAPQLGGGKDGIHHALDVADVGNAKDGAAAYARFLNGIRATNATGFQQHVTALGHSYGSLLVGKAAQLPGGIPADDIVFVGSPGVDAGNASDLSINPAHVWAGAASNDPVPKLAYIADEGNQFSLGYDFITGGPDATSGGYFNQNPTDSKFGANVFRVDPGGTGGFGMNAHGEYFDPGNRGDGSGLSSLQNMSDIIVGDYGNVKKL